MQRQPEPEYMDLPEEATAYAGADFADVNEAFVERLIEVVGPVETALCLDLGTGPGEIPLRLLRLRPGWRVAGLDASFAMLEFAVRAARDQQRADALWPVLCEAKECPFPDAAFDVVFSNSILHHITDVARFWAELQRVAGPGAVFLRDLARPDSAETARAIVAEHAGNESELLQEEFYRSLLSAYTVEEVQTQLQAAGIATLEVAKVTDRHLDVFGRLA